jgi:hypothetical protein
MELGKFESLVKLNLSDCSQLGCLPNSIVDLSQLKIFQFSECHKLENLQVEFRSSKILSLKEKPNMLMISTCTVSPLVLMAFLNAFM